MKQAVLSSLILTQALFAVSGILASCKDQLTEAPPTIADSDTTSHAFIWSAYDIGTKADLDAVWILNDSTIFVGGEIYLNDSTEENPRSIGIWDGHKWTFQYLYDQKGQLIPRVRSILGFGPSDIWLADGGVYHWDGHSSQVTFGYQDLYLVNGVDSLMRAFRIWGSSSSDLYAGGFNGFLAHFDGSTWTRIDTGTRLEIQDIWGAFNPTLNQIEVLAVASRTDQNQGKKLFRIVGNSLAALPDSGLSWALSGVWFAPNKNYYVVGAGIGQKANPLTQSSWHVYRPGEVTSYFSFVIRGNTWNDLFVAGAFGEVVHYNGSTWHNFIAETGFYGNYAGIFQRGNTVVVVGTSSTAARVMIGRRS